MLGGDLNPRELLADSSLRAGLARQCVAAMMSNFELYRALRTATPEQLQLKRRFALVLLRWMALVMVAYLGVGFVAGRFAALIFVAIYVAVSVVAELAPDRFLRVMPGGAEEAPPSGRPEAVRRDSPRRGRRRRKG